MDVVVGRVWFGGRRSEGMRVKRDWLNEIGLQ